MVANILKTSFAGGEFAPSLHSRVDIQRYDSGLKRARNFYIHPHGGASNRSGFEYIATAKYGDRNTELIPFEFSREQAYQIEAGDEYFRFYRNRGQIARGSADDWDMGVWYVPGDYVMYDGDMYYCVTNHVSTESFSADAEYWVLQSAYEIPSPYSADDVNGLKYVQSADVLFMAHGSHRPKMLSRYDHDDWTITDYPYEDGPFMLTNVSDTTITLAAGDEGPVVNWCLKDEAVAEQVSAIGGRVFGGPDLIHDDNLSSHYMVARYYGVPGPLYPADIEYVIQVVWDTPIKASKIEHVYGITTDDSGRSAVLSIRYSDAWHEIDTHSPANTSGSEWATRSVEGAWDGVTGVRIKFSSSAALSGVLVTAELRAFGVADASLLKGSDIILAASDDLFDEGHVGALWRISHYMEGQHSFGSFSSTGTSTPIRCGKTWRLITHGTWTGTFSLDKSADGGTTWSAVRVFRGNSDINHNTYGDLDADEEPCLLRISCTAMSSGTLQVDLTTDSYNHEGVAQVSGYIDSKHVTAVVRRAFGSSSATTDWAEGAWSDYRGWPQTVSFHQDRLCWASTRAEPHATWTTKTSNYYSFRRGSPLVDSDAISVRLPSLKMNGIEFLVPLVDLIAFTSSSEWTIGASEGNLFSPVTVNQRPHGYRGCASVQPIVIGNRCVYVQSKGSLVRDLGYDLNVQGLDGDDLSTYSYHLFGGYRIVKMAYQQAPDSIVWCVRNDGKLLSMTYVREQEMVAWTWHDTDGLFKSASCIPGDEQDELWCVVKRGSQQFIEVMRPRAVSRDPRKQFFLDAGLSYDYPVTITGATAASPVVVTAVGHGFANGDLVDIIDVEGMTELNGKRFQVANKTDDTFELTDEYTGAVIDGSDYGDYTGAGEVRLCVTTVVGLDHLEGREVVALANGSVVRGLTVSGGAVTFNRPYSIIHIGLSYLSQLWTLDVDLDLQDGTAQGRKMRIPQVLIKYQDSRGGYVGTDPDHLYEFKQRSIEPLGSPIDLKTGVYEQCTTSDPNYGAGVYIEQRDPLPMSIVGIIPRVVVGA